MENKYFTPNIEDLCVGYECEYNFAKAYTNDFKFVKIGYKDDEGYTNELTDMIHLIDDGAAAIRVPYLTKEQIEAEGWEYVKNTNTVDVDICHIFNKNNYMLGWFPLINKIAVLVRDPSKAFDEKGILIEYNNTERYTGSCKDINTFRKICKLLEI